MDMYRGGKTKSVSVQRGLGIARLCFESGRNISTKFFLYIFSLAALVREPDFAPLASLSLVHLSLL